MKESHQLDDDEFLRRMLQGERELLRYVMALVPDREDARDQLSRSVYGI